MRLCNVWRLLIEGLLGCILVGCASTPRNEPEASAATGTQVQARPAQPTLAFRSPQRYQSDPQRPFVGLAISGGGSRAANFGSAALLALDEIGLLKSLTVLSTVSGGSLAGAYYARYEGDAAAWNEAEIRRVMAQNFESKVLLEAVTPTNLFGELAQRTRRTDLLATALSDTLFHDATFQDLRVPILVNATTDDAFRAPFVFSDESFNALGSDLSRFPVAMAVASSAAFPGVFNSVSLANFKSKGRDGAPAAYLHVFDGGVVDNLGVTTLVDLYRSIAAASRKAQRAEPGCLLIVVNAEPRNYGPDDFSAMSKPERTGGLLVDSNVYRAMDHLFWASQYTTRASLQLEDPIGNAISEWLDPMDRGATRCLIWQISLQRVGGLVLHFAKVQASLNRHWANLFPSVEQIPTRFKLQGPAGFTAGDVQDLLFDAARKAVLEDPDRPALRVCHWLVDRSQRDNACEAYLSGAKHLPGSNLSVAALIDDRMSEDINVCNEGACLSLSLGTDSWKAVRPERIDVYAPSQNLFHAPSGATVRLVQMLLDSERPPGSKSRHAYVPTGSDDDAQRALAFLQDWVNKYVRFGALEADGENHLWQVALGTGGPAMASMVSFRPPRQALALQRSTAGPETLYSIAFTGHGATDVDCEVSVTAPRRLHATAGRQALMFMAAICTPATAPPDAAAAAKDDYRAMLSTLSED